MKSSLKIFAGLASITCYYFWVLPQSTNWPTTIQNNLTEWCKSPCTVKQISSHFYCHAIMKFVSIVNLLKLVSAIFYQIFIFTANDSPSKTMKNIFYFIGKALFVLEIFKFLWFFPFLTKLSRFKKTNWSGIIYVMNWLAQICRCNFWYNSEWPKVGGGTAK